MQEDGEKVIEKQERIGYNICNVEEADRRKKKFCRTGAGGDCIKSLQR